MRSKWLFILITAALLVSLPVSAATVAHWNFEDGVAGQPFTPVGQPGGSGGSADLVAGYMMYGWNDYYGPSFTDVTASGTGLAMRNADRHQDGYLWDAGLVAWAPAQWTIEASFMLTGDVVSAQRWQTLIGRDGRAASTPTGGASALYLQKTWDNYLRIDFATANGARYGATSTFQIVADQWYHIAATSDGSVLRLWVASPENTGWVLAAETDMTATANNGMSACPGNWTFGRGWWNGSYVDHINGYMDDIRFSDTALSPNEFVTYSAYNSSAAPLNGDSTVGTLVNGQATGITLNFMAGMDPNALNGNPFNPEILTHYVYVSNGTDPTPVYHGSVAQSSLTDPSVTYGPITLAENLTYYWKVEEGVDNGTGVAYPAGDPNNLTGPTWSFHTVASIPQILSGPVNTVADLSGNASLSVTASATADSFAWYRVGSTGDTLLTDDGKFSGTTTATLTITGATLADEGQYYCIGYNGATPSVPSPTAQLWTSRLMGYWKFDGSLADSVQDEVPGAPVHDGTMAVSSTEAGPGDPNYVGAGNGISGDAMSFHADGDYVTIAGPDFFNFYPQGFTTSFWYKASEPLVGWRLPVSKLDAGDAGWLFGTDHTYPSPQFAFMVEVPNIRLDGETTPDVGDGQWHMATITYDPTSNVLRLFTNGDEDDQATLDISGAPLATAPVSIGGRDTELSINGAIDEVRMYSYALTPAEVADLYTRFRTSEFVCVSESGFDSFDLTGDCRVTLEDFALIAQEWLECQRIPQEACNW